MTRSGVCLVVAGAIVTVAGAVAPLSASPDNIDQVDLALRRVPLPGALAMRPFGARATAPDRAGAEPTTSTPADRDAASSGAAGWLAARSPRDRADHLPPAHLSERVIFRFNLGFGIDGGELSATRPTVADQLLPSDEYSSLRIYGFGDAVIGTRGVVSPKLSSYFASRFRFDTAIGDRAGAIPTVWDANDSGLEIRHAYAEARGLFGARLLRPLAVRAGRQFRYGAAIAHFDGLTVSYDTRALTFGLYSGTRAVGLGPELANSSAAIAGFEVRLDLKQLRDVPLVLQVNGLSFADRNNLEMALALRTGPDLSMRVSVRSTDDRLAMERLVVHARLSDVTQLSADLTHRHGSDWMYDYALPAPPAQTLGDARRYLDLGPVVPRIVTTLRAGTVLLDNVDLLLHGAAAFDIAAATDPHTAYGDGYLELGAGFEVRVRRAIALGVSATGRTYRRPDVPARGDPTDLPDALPALPTGGESSFLEAGTTLRYSPGARRFSATAELYARSARYPSPWADDPSTTPRASHGGGRFSVEGWASNRFRFRAEYDVSTILDEAPELHGLKSLRLLAEGSF